MKKSVEDMTTDLAELSVIQGRGAGPSTGLEGSLAEVLAGVVHVERVPVDAHFFDDLGADSLVMAQFCARVRKRDDLPSVSMKDIYQHPTISRLAAAQPAAAAHVAPPAPLEGALADVLAGVVRADRVPVDAHFFDDLGADSLVMAQFCARVRKRDDLPSVSMKDIYQHPTIHSLATALGPAAPDAVLPSGATSLPEPAPAPVEAVTPASTRQYVVCRGAAAADLPRVLLPRRPGHRRHLRLDLGRLRRARRLPAVGRRRRRAASCSCSRCRSSPSGC